MIFGVLELFNDPGEDVWAHSNKCVPLGSLRSVLRAVKRCKLLVRQKVFVTV